jgi:succinate dehydrogenase / fumarate reductase cytochrome b subunit
MMRFAYYPGCVSKGSTPEADAATRWLAGKLGIELVELVDAGCCGSCEIKAVNPDLHLMLNARILSLAEAQGLEILTICDTCQSNLVQSARLFSGNSERKVVIFEKLARAGVRYEGKQRSRHLVRILADEFGPQKLKQHVVRPLDGLRVATFSCCHVFRGPGSDLANKPLIDQMVSVTGAGVESVRSDSDCCGFHILMVNEELAARAAGKFLKKCVEAQVDCIATTSPLCHAALDLYQRKAQASAGMDIPIPVLHVEQLLGLSFGGAPSALGLGRHMVSTERLVRKIAA